MLQAYAMTEASHQMTSNPLPEHGPHKPGTVGRAQGSVKVGALGSPGNLYARVQVDRLLCCLDCSDSTHGLSQS